MGAAESMILAQQLAAGALGDARPADDDTLMVDAPTLPGIECKLEGAAHGASPPVDPALYEREGHLSVILGREHVQPPFCRCWGSQAYPM